MTIRRIIATASTAVLLSAGLAGAASAEPRRMPPCLTEDSGPAPCLWDAQRRGNHLGDSFVLLDGTADGRIVYLSH